MGRYMTIVLKRDFKNDHFINQLNEGLLQQYGSNNSIKFNPWDYLQEEADYINNHPEGLKQLKDWPRPVTKEQLSENFFWYRHGEFSFKLSGSPTSDEARDAVAVCKWIIKTNREFIDQKKSSNYSSPIVREYLDHVFAEAKYDLKELWKISQ